jgi:hypothetical protein
MSSATYVAVIGDVVASRELAPARRRRLQETLRAELARLNRRAAWRRSIAARFAVAAGDEIEGLLTSAAPLWALSHTLRAALPDVDVIVACGRGPIATALAPTAPEVDGPCFHLARAALDAAKPDRQVFAFGGFDDPRLPGLAGYYSGLYWSWTRRQRRMASAWRAELPAGPDALVPSAYSHLRRRMAWPLVQAGDRMLRAILEKA